MVRENNKKEYKGNEEEQPKFGAGSEFGREEREEARRKKFGYSKKKYDPDMQPWLMRVGKKEERKHYKGQREGGVSDNTTFYVFTNAPDGCFEAYPIKEWYNFVPRVTYQTLDADEAEEKFAQRGKILNHWAVKLQKKLKPDQDDDDDLDDEDGKKGKKKGGKKEKDFKISDMDDDWMGGSGDELDSESDDDDDDKKKNKKKKDDGDSDEDTGSKKKGKKKRSKEDVENEAFEDSDDGEGEGREVDYMSDESSEEEDVEEAKHDIAGVDQDEGLSKMLDSDDSEEEEEDKDKDKDEEEEKKDDGKKSGNNSRSGSPKPEDKGGEKSSKAEKRKAMVDKLLDPNAGGEAKRGRFDAGPSSSQPASNSIEASFEEDVRRYLARKAMTTTEILRKMTQKKTGLPKEELLPLLVNVLKRINPHKQKVKGTMYLSLKTGK